MEPWKEVQDRQIENAVIKEASVVFPHTVCTPELVKEACLQLKDVKWCDEVDFSCNDLTLEGLRYICELIIENKFITALNLSHNAFDHECFVLIASSLPESDVSTLILEDTNLTTKDLEEMSDLSKAHKLCCVNFRSNSLNDEGLRRLFFYLQHCDCMLEVDLGNNNITALSLSAVADFIEENEKIRKIDITGVGMDPHHGRQFRILGETADCDIRVTIDSGLDRDPELGKTIMPSMNTLLFYLQEKYRLVHGDVPFQVIYDPIYPTPVLDPEESEMDIIPTVVCSKLQDVERYIMNKNSVHLEEIVNLVLQNFALFQSFLEMDPSLNLKNEDFEISLDSHILSSVGEINRCGQIRVEIVGLMASLVFTQQPKVIRCIIKSGLPKTIFSLYKLFPWNSVLHYQCDRFFCYSLGGNSCQLLTYLFEKVELQKLIITAMGETNVGYHGWMMRLVDVIQYVFEQHEEYKRFREDEEWNQFLEETQKPILSKRVKYTNEFKN